MSDIKPNKIIIAVDGFSSCGKSTFAKAIAARLGYIFIDTGAMYRAVTLYALGFIEDFVDEYMQEHHTDTIDNRTFSITDADYDAFVKFMEGKEVPYESETRRVLKVLKEAAENDLYSDLAQEITAIEGDLKDDTQTNLHTYRKEIAETINNDIVLRHSYQAGVIEHNLGDDTEVLRATEVLENPTEYQEITTVQTSEKK